MTCEIMYEVFHCLFSKTKYNANAGLCCWKKHIVMNVDFVSLFGPVLDLDAFLQSGPIAISPLLTCNAYSNHTRCMHSAY